MLSRKEIKPYWDQRSAEHGAGTVGFMNRTDEYDEKFDFILQHINPELSTLDYGCGVGLYAQHFDSYIGLEITRNLWGIAIDRNPEKDFVLLDEPGIPEGLTFKPEQVFTATVLQHNSDEVVDEIFKSFKRFDYPVTYSFYENSEKRKSGGHMAFRQPADYIDMLSKYKEIKNAKFFEHNVHGENHAITIIEA